MVLPEPTSPCSIRFIGRVVASSDESVSSTSRWPAVSSNGNCSMSAASRPSSCLGAAGPDSPSSLFRRSASAHCSPSGFVVCQALPCAFTRRLRSRRGGWHAVPRLRRSDRVRARTVPAADPERDRARRAPGAHRRRYPSSAPSHWRGRSGRSPARTPTAVSVAGRAEALAIVFSDFVPISLPTGDFRMRNAGCVSCMVPLKYSDLAGQHHAGASVRRFSMYFALKKVAVTLGRWSPKGDAQPFAFAHPLVFLSNRLHSRLW